MTLNDLTIKLFVDSADLASMIRLAQFPYVRGFTTNPTLMQRAKVLDYETFAKAAVAALPHHSFSFEVIADTLPEMDRQARRIAAWGPQVYVKIPVTTTTGLSTVNLVRGLSFDGIFVNVTAITECRQVKIFTEALTTGVPSYFSLFAGRIADTGRDPVAMMSEALDLIRSDPSIEMIWASPREVLNVVQANNIHCHIITVTPDLLAKLPALGTPLASVSLATVRMFYTSARESGLTL